MFYVHLRANELNIYTHLGSTQVLMLVDKPSKLHLLFQGRYRGISISLSNIIVTLLYPQNSSVALSQLVMSKSHFAKLSVIPEVYSKDVVDWPFSQY
jgi:hypothetical protein